MASRVRFAADAIAPYLKESPVNMTQNLHGIASIQLTAIEERDTREAGHYWVRTLIIIGHKGEETRLEMFGDTEAALALPGEKEASKGTFTPASESSRKACSHMPPVLDNTPEREMYPAKYEVESDPPMELPF